MDLLYCGALLPIAGSVGLTALALSRVIDGEDALFQQTRIGQSGHPFTMYKIRTLSTPNPDSPSSGHNDQRATSFGKKLRFIGIDELPQVINVLRGDMSFVGPRAVQPSDITTMQDALPDSIFQEWLEAYCSSRPGGISSFGIHERLHRGQSEETRYLVRARLDIEDFKNTSADYDSKLVKKVPLIAFRLAASRLGV